ncbi:glycoside hydrolase family 16 protein [Collybiopsis luxurians FD-317 M1]|nr:glycoside hydrolase family 16 protein [Collybiopsis luxurians FD-317 M1]
MMLPLKISSITIILLATPALSQQYFYLTDRFIGQDFFTRFHWDTFDDPTHGRVNYVNQEIAQATNLSYASSDKFIMRADSYAMVPPYSRGRDSVRITSNECWGDSIIIADVSHIPEGCATWPAFWTASEAGPWPLGGEIDIIEGVNLNSNNLASLHTSPGCSMGDKRMQSGQVSFSHSPSLPVSPNCDSAVNSNQGCGVASTIKNSYGSGFNNNGGGCVPDEIRNADYKDPIPGADSDWGTPAANFSCETCDYTSHFDNHQLIFDLTFCGDWAGNAFSTAGCGSGTCQDFVDNQPNAFRDAYWEINSLRVYTPK